METTLAGARAHVCIGVRCVPRTRSLNLEAPSARLIEPVTINRVTYKDVDIHYRYQWGGADWSGKHIPIGDVYAGGEPWLTDAARRRVLDTYADAFLNFVRENWLELRAEALASVMETAQWHVRNAHEESASVIAQAERFLAIHFQPQTRATTRCCDCGEPVTDAGDGENGRCGNCADRLDMAEVSADDDPHSADVLANMEARRP